MPPPAPSPGPDRRLFLPALIATAVLAHARWCLPKEACGLLAVDTNGLIRMAYPLTNTDPGPDRFTIAPDEHFGALKHAEARGWEIGGVFHSHPEGPAVPSPTDLAQPYDPSWVHLVVGCSPTLHIRGWKIRDGRATELVIISDSPGSIYQQRKASGPQVAARPLR